MRRVQQRSRWTWSWCVVVVVLGTVGVAACESLPDPSGFHVGMSRSEVVARFGEPHDRQSLVKTASSIWGPIETFWSSVPPDSRVEIWSYPAVGGTVELYFVDDSEDVRGTGFAPEGAVY